MTRLESTCMHSSGHVRVCLTKSPFLNGNRKEPHWKSQIRTRKAGITKIPALPAFPPAVLSSQELSQLFSSGGHPILAAFPNPLGAYQFQTPMISDVLNYLLANPLVTFGLAVFLYITIPRLWRAFVRFIVIPAIVLATAYIVVKNPATFSNVGSTLTHFTSDHPYATSAVILIGLTLVLSPYLLTGLLVLFVATGLPRLPAPIRNFLPPPMREIEQQFNSFDASVRGPIDSIKQQALRLGSGISTTGTQLADTATSSISKLQRSQEAPALTTPETDRIAKR